MSSDSLSESPAVECPMLRGAHLFTVGTVTHDLRSVVRVQEHPIQEGFILVTFASGETLKFERPPFVVAYEASLARSTAAVSKLTLEGLGAAGVNHEHSAADLPGPAGLLEAKSLEDLRTKMGAAAQNHNHPAASLTGLSSPIRAMLAAENETSARRALKAAAAEHTHTVREIVDAGPVLDIVANVKSTTELRAAIAAAPREHTHVPCDLDGLSPVIASLLSASSASEVRQLLGAGSASRLEVADIVSSTDPRLSDARLAVPHAHALPDIGATALGQAILAAFTPAEIRSLLCLGSAAARNIADYGDAAARDVVVGADTRLTDARQALPHDHHVNELDGVNPAWKQVLSGDVALQSLVPLVLDTERTEPSVRVNGRWVPLPKIPAAADFAPAEHTHPPAPIPTAAAVGADAAGTAALAVAIHAAAALPHGASGFGFALLQSDAAAARRLLQLGDLAFKFVGDVVNPADPRLSDMRVPVAHKHAVGDMHGVTPLGDTLLRAESPDIILARLGLKSAATRRVAEIGNALPEEVVRGDDTRLSDARPPQAHTHKADEFALSFLDLPLLNNPPAVSASGRARLFVSRTGGLQISIDGAPYQGA